MLIVRVAANALMVFIILFIIIISIISIAQYFRLRFYNGNNFKKKLSLLIIFYLLKQVYRFNTSIATPGISSKSRFIALKTLRSRL